MGTARIMTVEIRYTGEITRVLNRVEDLNTVFSARNIEKLGNSNRYTVKVSYDSFVATKQQIVNQIRSINGVYSIKIVNITA